MKFIEYTGTLSKKAFILGIEYLSTFYSNFKFWNEDFENQVELRKQLWYNTFRDMQDNHFTKLVENYCTANIFAPQSPAHLLDFAKAEYKRKYPSAESEYLKVKNIVVKNGYYFNSNERQVKELDPITYETYQLTKTLFNTAFYDINKEPECRRTFIKTYDDILERKVSKIKVGEMTNEIAKTPFYSEAIDYLANHIIRLLEDIKESEEDLIKITFDGLAKNTRFKALDLYAQQKVYENIKNATNGKYETYITQITLLSGKETA